MWLAHQYLSARDCHYNDDGASRLLCSDTDRAVQIPLQYLYPYIYQYSKRIFNIIINIFFYSFTTSTERLRSSIETTELDLLLKEHNLGISYTSSYHAKRYAEIYVKVHGLVLDWSSVGKEVNFFSNKFYILLNIKKKIFF